MTRDLDHLELASLNQNEPLRKHRGGPGTAPPVDPSVHGADLLRQVDGLTEHLEEVRRTSPPDIDPAFIFKLELRPGATLGDALLRRMGLHVLATEADHALVVFPDQETLDALRNRVDEFSRPDGHKYAEVASIQGVFPWTAEDRTGPRLLESPLGVEEIAAFDIELWHTGNHDKSEAAIREITLYLATMGINVTDRYAGKQLCLLRAKLNLQALTDLLTKIDKIKEIDRRPKPTFDMLSLVRSEVADFNIDVDLHPDTVGIVLLDSGVATGHPMLRAAVGDAQVFLDTLQVSDTHGAEDGDEADNGHGTAVAGIAAYSDVYGCISEGQFSPSAALFSARITDAQNQYAEDLLLETQLRNAVEYFVNNYFSVKVINISLGNRFAVYEDDRYQFRFAAAIDELAYELRDKNIVFVVSAGNLTLDDLADLSYEEIKVRYPSYLLEDRARLIDPATSAIALTVGGLSYGAGRSVNSLIEESTGCAVAGMQGWPSPFTRTGWGVGGAIKPDVVEYAGDWYFEKDRIYSKPQHVGVPTTSRAFVTEGLFRTVAGTSFAAPKVANLAARLFRDFPGASANLIRALIAESAELPNTLPPSLSGLDPWDNDILRIYGYGQPSYERARWSDHQDVLLLTESALPLEEDNQFQLFEIPPLPDEFRVLKGQAGRTLTSAISVTLAYDPPTRHTRMADYLGVTMGFRVFRNTTSEAVASALRVLSAEEKESYKGSLGLSPSLGNLKGINNLPAMIDLKPGAQLRNKGTLQHGVARISSSSWQYDGGPLILAVECRRGWAPTDVTSQRYAVIVRLHHDSLFVDLYSYLLQHTKVYQRARARLYTYTGSNE